MPNYAYTVFYAHGSAEGHVRADTPAEAQQKAKDMYHGQSRDTVDSKGKPVVVRTEVTKVTVKEVKE